MSKPTPTARRAAALLALFALGEPETRSDVAELLAVLDGERAGLQRINAILESAVLATSVSELEHMVSALRRMAQQGQQVAADLAAADAEDAEELREVEGRVEALAATAQNFADSDYSSVKGDLATLNETIQSRAIGRSIAALSSLERAVARLAERAATQAEKIGELALALEDAAE